jgi:hypothetical protein
MKSVRVANAGLKVDGFSMSCGALVPFASALGKPGAGKGVTGGSVGRLEGLKVGMFEGWNVRKEGKRGVEAGSKMGKRGGGVGRGGGYDGLATEIHGYL